MANILITGTGSGLGKYLWANIHDSAGLSRENTGILDYPIFYDTIIHCAFNKQKIEFGKTPSDQINKFIQDNVILTNDLLKIPHKKFVYISTIDVYNEGNSYALFKLMAENMVMQDPDSLIIRPSMLLGDTMKPNHVTKIKDNTTITLHSSSEFNYILMEDLLKFFTSGDYLNLSGILDFVADTDVEISEVIKYFNSKSKTGHHIHDSQSSYFKNKISFYRPEYKSNSFKNLKRYFENE